MPRTRSQHPVHHLIQPTTGFAGLQLAEVWRYRELLLVFAWRNVLLRYKQTVLGAGWAILQPVFMMIVFTLFFNRLGRVSSGGLPYPIFSYAGFLPWTFFAASLTAAAASLVSNQNMLRKIYFPRLLIPLSSVLTSLVDFVIASVVLFALMGYYGTYPEPVRLLALPALVLLAIAAALGVGLWLAALNVLYRDVQYVVPFLSQAWLFATPSVYVAKTFHHPWDTIIGINPMQGAIAGFRWALLRSGPAPGPALAVSAGVAVVLLATGVVFFRRLERQFADAV